MKISIRTNWTQKELFTYLFIYCMNADFKETEEELDFITSKVGNKTFTKIHKEFNQDNDYSSLLKIKDTLYLLDYSYDRIEQLFNEIKTLFLSDRKYEVLEKNIMTGLKRILY